jgi:uncharacterized metal-binding protein
MIENKKTSCNCGSTRNIVYSCSGASNVGQLANEVAIRVAGSGKASMGCLIGIGAGISTMTMNARSADSVTIVDGCPQCCGRKMLEKAGISNIRDFVITDMGIKKTCDLRGDREMLEELADKVIDSMHL